MAWFKVNDRWCINLAEIRDLGIPKDHPETIMVTFKDGHEEFYGCKDPQKIFDEFVKFVCANPIEVKVPSYGGLYADEVLKSLEG